MHEASSQRGSPRVQRSPISDLSPSLNSKLSSGRALPFFCSAVAASPSLSCSLCFFVLVATTVSSAPSFVPVRKREKSGGRERDRVFVSHCPADYEQLFIQHCSWIIRQAAFRATQREITLTFPHEFSTAARREIERERDTTAVPSDHAPVDIVVLSPVGYSAASARTSWNTQPRAATSTTLSRH